MDDATLEGPYFNTRYLAELSKSHTYFSGMKMNLLLSAIRNNNELAPSIVDAIEDMGFRRIAFLEKGRSSLAFSGINDETGNGQLILLTPGNEDYIPHPTMLPAKEKRIVDKGEHLVLVRVMPQLDVGGATEQHAEQLIELIEKSGLEVLIGGQGPDIREHNIGLYRYLY